MKDYLNIIKQNEARFIKFIEACDNRVISLRYDEEERCVKVFMVPDAHKYSATYLNKMVQTAKKYPLFYGTSVCTISIDLSSQKVELQNCFVNRTPQWTQGMSEIQKKIGQCLTSLDSKKEKQKEVRTKKLLYKDIYNIEERDDLN